MLAFRGTANAHDGLQDMKFIRKSIDHLQELFPGVQAHTGEQVLHYVGESSSLNRYLGGYMQGMVGASARRRWYWSSE